LLLTKDDREQIVLLYGSLLGNIQLLERLWHWAKE